MMVSDAPGLRTQIAPSLLLALHDLDDSGADDNRAADDHHANIAVGVQLLEAVAAALPQLDVRLVDPKSDNPDQTPAFAKNESRAIKPEIVVLEGVCTHLGCSPQFKPAEDKNIQIAG